MNKLCKPFKPTINIATLYRKGGWIIGAKQKKRSVERTHEDMDFNKVKAWTCQCTSNTQISVKLNKNRFSKYLFRFSAGGRKLTGLGKDDTFLVVCVFSPSSAVSTSCWQSIFSFSSCHSSKYWPYLRVLTIQFTSYAYWLFCCYCECCVHHYFLVFRFIRIDAVVVYLWPIVDS